jgi:hypothetical protein
MNKAGDPAQPATETRGGRKPDWGSVRPGEPAPERPEGDTGPPAGEE